MAPPAVPDRLTRAEALALVPAELLALGLASPLPERLRALGPIALVEQLRAEGTPQDALGLWIAALSGPAAAHPEDLVWQAGDGPAAQAWAAALAAAVTDAERARGAVELLLLSLQFWGLASALRRRPSADAEGAP